MSPELATSLLQFGIGGIFLIYLWQETKRLVGLLDVEREGRRRDRDRFDARLEELRERHRKETDKLRADIADRDRQRFKEATDYGATLWQFTESVKSLADQFRRQARTSGAQIHRQDDS